MNFLKGKILETFQWELLNIFLNFLFSKNFTQKKHLSNFSLPALLNGINPSPFKV